MLANLDQIPIPCSLTLARLTKEEPTVGTAALPTSASVLMLRSRYST